MNKHDSISVQEVRKDPLSFLKKINEGKTLTVIYHSKPYSVVTSAEKQVKQKNGELSSSMLALAQQARSSKQEAFDSNKTYKELYRADIAKKYDIS